MKIIKKTNRGRARHIVSKRNTGRPKTAQPKHNIKRKVRKFKQYKD